MSIGSQRVHIVTTSFDYVSGRPEDDRIGYIFDSTQTGADKVYVLSNNELRDDEHRRMEEAALRNVTDTIKEKTGAHERAGIENIEVNFYDFEETLITVYELMYRETQLGNDVYVNVSGGTKPVAIAMVFACAITETERPPYYVPREYQEEEGAAVTTGILDKPVQISTLHVFNLANLLPSDDEKSRIIRWLLSVDAPIGVTDLLVEKGRVPEDPAETMPDPEESRNSVVQRYHRHANQLVNERILTKAEGAISLTETGFLIGRILEVRQTVDEEIEEHIESNTFP